jgi:hypothetical protein
LLFVYHYDLWDRRQCWRGVVPEDGDRVMPRFAVRAMMCFSANMQKTIPVHLNVVVDAVADVAIITEAAPD